MDVVVRFLLDGPFAVFDLETTGVDVETDRIVTACVGLLQPRPNGEPWGQQIESHIVSVDDDIPPEATKVHGITTAWARANGQPPDEVVFKIVHRLASHLRANNPLVGMNLAFDLSMLDRECRRSGHTTLDVLVDGPVEPVVDVYVIDKWLDPYRTGGRKLTDLIRFYNVRHEGAHDSTGDALAAGRVAYRMALLAQSGHAVVKEIFQSLGRRRPEEIADRASMLADMTPRQLHQNQISWRPEQMESLREYLIGKGERNPDCDPHWPIKPYKAPEEVNQG